MQRFRLVLLFTAAGLLAGCAAAFLRPILYTSHATLKVYPAQVPDRYVPGVPALDLPSFVSIAAPTVLSRGPLRILIQQLDLYRRERARMPLEDVIEIFRNRVQLHPGPNATLAIAFSDTDRYRAQRAAAEIAARLIGESARNSDLRWEGAIRFLAGQADAAAAEWSKYDAQLRASGKPDERLALDRDLARKQYVELKARLSEARVARELAQWRLGPSLEMLDPASRPDRPRTSATAIVGAGALGGFLLGLLIHLAGGLWLGRFSRLVPAY